MTCYILYMAAQVVAQALVDLMAGWLKSEEQVARELVSDGVREDCTKHKQAKATGWTAALTVD